MGLQSGKRYWALHGLFAALGTLATLFLASRGLSPVAASGLVGVGCSLGLITWGEERHFSIAAFTGSFAGMTGGNLLTGWGSVVGLVFLTALLFFLSEKLTTRKPHWTYDGFGGRLGTIALVSVLGVLGLETWIIGTPDRTFWELGWTGSWDNWLWSVPAASLGAGTAWAVKRGLGSLNSNHRVLAIALTGLIGALVFPAVWGSDLGQTLPETLSVYWYAGAFAGMSSADILPGKKYYLAAGAVTGLFCPLLMGCLPGAGGRLGFTAFLAVLAVRWLAVVRNPARFRPRPEPGPEEKEKNGPTRT